MNRRKQRGPIDHKQVRELIDAHHHAKRIGRPLNVAIAIHPAVLDETPADIGLWLQGLLNKLRIWCSRKSFGYFIVWSRENFEGLRREHVHMLVHVPASAREDFEDALERWCPGAPTTVKCVDVTDDGALNYLIKQMTPQAWFSLGKRVTRRNVCKDTGAKVSKVLGKRCGVSTTLGPAARKAYRDRRDRRVRPAQTAPAVEPKSIPLAPARSDSETRAAGVPTPLPPPGQSRETGPLSPREILGSRMREEAGDDRPILVDAAPRHSEAGPADGHVVHRGGTPGRCELCDSQTGEAVIGYGVGGIYTWLHPSCYPAWSDVTGRRASGVRSPAGPS